MEGRKTATATATSATSGVSSSYSSLSSDLFGTKDSNSSSTGIFSSMFSSSSTGLGMDSSRSEAWRKQSHDQVWNGKQMSTDGIPQSSEHRSVTSKERRSVFVDETVEPCFLCSSLYYGGRDICSHSPSTRASGTGSTYQFKKDGGEDDSSNSNSASRGNWWQGSLYY